METTQLIDLKGMIRSRGGWLKRQSWQRDFCMNRGQPNWMHFLAPFQKVIERPASETPFGRTGVRRRAHHRTLSTGQPHSVTLPRSAGGNRWWHLDGLYPRTKIEEH